MLSKEKLARINELAKKSKQEGLSNDEKLEQRRLREEYLKVFRSSMAASFREEIQMERMLHQAN